MKLEKVLDNLNSFEKNAFLKIIDSILAKTPKNSKAVDQILSDSSRDLKNMDNINIVKVFNLVESEFIKCIKGELGDTSSQFDILIDIVTRDGNSIMKQDWFARHYEKELNSLNKKLKEFKKAIDDEKSGISDARKRDYRIYLSCIKTAFYNDDTSNLERKITSDELSIILTLANELGLSQEEVKLINYLIIPVKKQDIDEVINELRTIGCVFYSKKTSTLYVADEIVRVLRKVRGKEVADKYFRRVLKSLREPQINMICRQHGLDWRLPLDQKIRAIISEGISFSGIFMNDIHKEGSNVTDKKKEFNDFCEKRLMITPPLKGTLLEEKIGNLIKYFEDLEADEKVGISVDGYDRLVRELDENLKGLNQLVRSEFELQEEHVLKSAYLLDYNIKPRDILELIPEKELAEFCKFKEIKTRGDEILNILEAYKDADNLYLENYENIGFRNLLGLKESGLIVKEAELGVKFEELTKKIFHLLGFNVNEELRKKLNTNKDLIDIVLDLGNNDLILIECKTIKESGYNKFSAVSRQLKSYTTLAKHNNYKVIKSLLVAPDFSDDFIKECGLEYELNLSLITASTLIKILGAFKSSKHKQFPHNLLMRDVLIQEDRVLKAIGK